MNIIFNKMDNLRKYEKILELPKILKMLSDETYCDETKELVASILPTYSYSKTIALLNQTNDAHMLIARFGSPSFGGIKSITNPLERAKSGGILTMGELLRIGEALRVFRSIKEWKSRSESIETTLDIYFNDVIPNKYFEDRISSSILSEDEMCDTASPLLFDIRRKIKSASSKVRSELDKMIHSPKYQKYLQDPIVTIRDGRFVVPVKAEYRNEIHGLVHDTSASGSTVFIEPLSVVETNNDIKVFISKEKAEIERILTEMSTESGSFADSIILSYNYIIIIDLILAKAKLAYKMKASMPVINQDGKINLKKARHPLIKNDTVVPIDINLGDKFDTLVITGPNTGGKTVSIKTIGLFTIMAMCGLMIPAYDNSTLSIFKKVLVDIGDEQSIEQSLSTFSSHMTNIIEIIKEADENSLVIFDELGAGTDPVEGAALAMSILENIREKNSKIAATTHYSELKEYALRTDKVENACCEFDVDTLRPTYKLLIGIPGSSNAFAISEKLGMAKTVVEKAKSFIASEKNRFEEVIKTIEKTKNELEKEQKKACELRLETQRFKEDAENEYRKIKNESQKEIEKSKQKALNMFQKASAKTLELLDELNEIKKNKDTSSQTRTRLKSKLKELEETTDPINKKIQDDYNLPRNLKEGDSVLIFDIDKTASVLEREDSSGKVLVQAGIIKTRVPISNLRLIETVKKKNIERSTTRTVKNVAKRDVNISLDLRGRTVLEAIMEVDSFIDNAVISGLNQLTIIHGKGTGVLRKEVQAHLKKHPSVRSYRLGVFGEGEAGVTIVDLK